MYRLEHNHFGEPWARERVCSAVKHVVPTLAVAMLLLGAAPVPLWAASDAAVSGVVRDGRGTPQLGALVELLAPDATLIARAFTDEHGRFALNAVLPGTYQLRASAAFLVPVTRANLHLRGGAHAIADLTLTAIFEAGVWLPAEKRNVSEPIDDWRWTLRSTANRPLLRLADQSVDVPNSDVSSSSDHPRNSVSRGQIAFMSGDGSFGQGGNRQVITVGRSAADGDVSIVKADLGNNSPGTAASVVVAAGLEHERTWGGGTRMIISFASHPELETGASEGLQVFHTAAAEKIALGDAVLIDAGTLFTAEHLMGTRFESAPYLRVAFRPTPEVSIEYRLATDRSVQRSEDLDDVAVREEALVDSTGQPLVLKGLHQEVSLTHTDEKRVLTFAAYRDHSPLEPIQGGGLLTQHDLSDVPALYDPTTQTLRIAVPGDTTGGVRGTWTETFSPMFSACVEGAVGGALEAEGRQLLREDLAGQMHAHMVGALGGKLQIKATRTGTLVNISYRWQPGRSLTQVDEYAVTPADTYLGIRFRQKLWTGRRLKGLNAVVEATNLLSQGYEPVVGADGQTFFLAQMPRGIQGGLAFSF